MGIAYRFATILVVAVLFGGALGWSIDWAFAYFGIHTKPVFLIVSFMLGSAAGIRGVLGAAKGMNEQMARSMPSPEKAKEDETS
jgi:F0F1-type ATP synthase assembly protein I